MDSRSQEVITEKKATDQAKALEEIKALLAESGIRSMIVVTIKLDVNPRTYRYISYQPTELAVFSSGRLEATVTMTGDRSNSYVVSSPEPAIKINGLDSPETVAALLSKILTAQPSGRV